MENNKGRGVGVMVPMVTKYKKGMFQLSHNKGETLQNSNMFKRTLDLYYSILKL